MGWLNKIFKGSSHSISEGQYVGKYREEHVWDAPSTPPVILLYSLFFLIILQFLSDCGTPMG